MVECLGMSTKLDQVELGPFAGTLQSVGPVAPAAPSNEKRAQPVSA